jgi:dTDP-glucose pyrophosphorylase
MIALIPMAGAGSRFTEEGYTVPKPLLPILGKPMVVSAAEALPGSKRHIFIIRDFQIEQYQVDEHLKSHFPDCEIVVLDHLTEGQAVTCLHAKDYINNSQELVIGASDNGMIYSATEFETAKEQADALVFSFRKNPAVKEKPQAYGWIKTLANNDVEGMSVKVPISDSPMNDHAVVGTFWFKEGRMFIEAAERMIEQDRRINNEFYVDECINDLIDLGYKVKVFEIDHYVCWGTPNDYKTFNYWESFYEKIGSQVSNI